ncbi:MAG: MarR family transcriptional regulator [Faecalicatena sp.]|uniref:MarR family winged helix-turn-helix transcriptional regulator n=1 Tax=Faecalicatena sp. TaxID=2005360 RepID=UPI002586B877|nr:MarR family transcriptional regulator [Faecalicatena sp.]MCI6467232.1 MarR family transcriptional regulator [Faecalicatena sp.]MDY5620237.1 MarR family transcriptional regulator [Lachnospiraceae bacterium]
MEKKEIPEWIRHMEMIESIRLFSNLYTQKTPKGAFCTAQEVDALFRIELGHGSLSPYELSRQMGVSKPLVSRLLESLTEKALVEKKASESDRRSYRLDLTVKGRETLESTYYYFIEPLERLEKKLGKDQCSELLRLIALANTKNDSKQD